MSFALPSTLTPSKLTRFMSCPLAFRFSYIEQLPEPPSPHLVRGTLVHRALELLFDSSAHGARTAARAAEVLHLAWGELADGDIAGLGLSEEATVKFRAEAEDLITRYFTIEDPTGVHPIGVELDLRTELDGVVMRGIIDRLDRLPGGELVVVDYKTGRAPRAEHLRARLTGVHFYALLCERVLGRAPREVRLLYLRDPVVITESPSAQTMRGIHQRALAVWKAIERACELEDFRPSPSPLCKTCAFQPYCPAFGGDPSLASADASDGSRAAVVGRSG
jgi:putative RecB family exonuclease